METITIIDKEFFNKNVKGKKIDSVEAIDNFCCHLNISNGTTFLINYFDFTINDISFKNIDELINYVNNLIQPETITETQREAKEKKTPEPEPIQTIQIEQPMQTHENTAVTKPTIINKQPFYNSPKFNLYKIDFIRAFLFTSLASGFFYAKKYIAFEVDLLPYFFVTVFFTHILINFFKNNSKK